MEGATKYLGADGKRHSISRTLADGTLRLFAMTSGKHWKLSMSHIRCAQTHQIQWFKLRQDSGCAIPRELKVHEDAHVTEREEHEDGVEPVEAAQLAAVGHNPRRALLSHVLVQGLV